MAGLGLGLNLNPRQRQGFQTAAQSGSGNVWLAQHQRIANRASRLDPTMASRVQTFATTGTTPWIGTPKGPATGATPPPAAPPVTPPPAGPTPTWGDIAAKYSINIPPELTTVSDFATKNLPTVGQFDNSRYEEQFNRLMQQSGREGDITAAKLRESYGSMGARYGSDIATAEADMRRKQTLDLQAAGYDVRQGLNQQRLAELAGTVGALQNVGASRGNIAESAAARAWQDYSMQMKPPSQWDEMMGYATSFSPPGTALY